MHPEHFRLLLQAALAAPAPAPVSDATQGTLVMAVATFISQIKVNGVASFVIQKLKDSKTPALAWINANTPWISRAVALVAAAATAVGLKWTYAEGTLTITGLTATAIVTALWHVAQNYLFQHAWYKTVFAPGAAPAPVPAEAQQGAK